MNKLSNPSAAPSIKVHGTEILASDSRQRYREKIARITLDSMVQFVGLLDAQGTVLEINKVALDGVGVKLADVEGRPFWTPFWWQVSPEINQGIRDAIARAAKGEFARWDTPIYGRAGGTETIIIDASVMPVKDEDGNVVYQVIARNARMLLIRASDWGRGMILVAVSGWGQEEDRRLARAAGFDEHRAKPVNFAELDSLLARCAGRD